MDLKEKKYVEKIMNNYIKQTPSKIDELRMLNRKVYKSANIFAYIFGTIGALVLGFGMSIAMEVIFVECFYFGILAGILGMFMVTINYFIHRYMVCKSKEKYSCKICELSEELLNNN